MTLRAFWLNYLYFRAHNLGWDRKRWRLAGYCRERLREGHLLARYGGDEFAVLLLECDQADAQRVAERLQHGVNALSIDTGAGPLNMRLLAGCATLDDTCPDLQTLISRAEADMVMPDTEAANGVGPASGQT